MKNITILFCFISFLSIQEKAPRAIPADLRAMEIIDFNEPDEILRIWRFPEGGAVFEELIEIRRSGNKWSSSRYTYLLDEFRNNPKYQNYRDKQNLNLSSDQIASLVNEKLLKNPKLTNQKQIFLSDMYLAEYRLADKAIFFEFFLEESGNRNSAKANLVTFLDSIINQ